MNMLDGLKVEYIYNGRKHYGVIIQTQILPTRGKDYLAISILNENRDVDVRNFQDVDFKKEDLKKILNNPQETINKIRKAEIAQDISDRFDILDL